VGKNRPGGLPLKGYQRGERGGGLCPRREFSKSQIKPKKRNKHRGGSLHRLVCAKKKKAQKETADQEHYG